MVILKFRRPTKLFEMHSITMKDGIKGSDEFVQVANIVRIKRHRLPFHRYTKRAAATPTMRERLLGGRRVINQYRGSTKACVDALA